MRKLVNYRVDLSPGRYTLINGFGMYDIAAGGWISLASSKVEGVQVPTVYRRKSTAMLAIRDGQCKGYILVASEVAV